MKNAAAASSARASAVARRAAQYVPAAVPATTPNAVAPASRLRSAGSPRRLISATLFCGGAHGRPRSLCRYTPPTNGEGCTRHETAQPAHPHTALTPLTLLQGAAASDLTEDDSAC